MAVEKKAKNSGGPSATAGPSKVAAAPVSTVRTAPSFTSALKDEETDFPRGGGTSLTALEMKQIRDEGRREADEEVAKEVSSGLTS